MPYRFNIFTGSLDYYQAQSGSGAISNILLAGQSFSANRSYAVRWGIEANGENVNQVYVADDDTSSFDEFWVIGIALSTSSVSPGAPITVYSFGTYNLGSSDTPFSTSDVGKPVWLTSAGSFSVTAPSGLLEADEKIGIVMSANQIWINDQLMGVGGSAGGGGGGIAALDVTYIPGNSSNWVNPQPTTVQEALDRIAGVLGSVTPIP